jgi:hypothetical protein
MKIVIGQSEDRTAVGFDLDTLIVTRALITANSGAGKSYLLRKFTEQLFGHIQVIVIDPEGEFATLREKFGYVLVGKGGETPADVRSAGTVAEKLLEIRASAVCDLYEMKTGDRHRWVQAFLDAMVNAPKELWHPVVIIIDEAHVFCPEKGAGESIASDSVVDLITRGRKRGFCAVLATQRLAKLRKDASAELLNRLVGGTFEDVDLKRALNLLSVAPEDQRKFSASLRVLEPGWFYALGRAIAKQRVLFKGDRVVTSHPTSGSAKHAAGPPPPPDQVKALLPQLADLPKVAEEKARTVDDLKAKIRSLTSELSAAKREPAAPVVDQAKIKSAIENAVRAALRERDTLWMRNVSTFISTVRSKVRGAAAAVDREWDNCPFVQPDSIGLVTADVEVAVSNIRGAERIQRAPVSPPKTSLIPSLPKSDTNGSLTRPQMSILSALAQFEAIGRASVDKKWIAALAGVSHSSSSYGNNLGYLRSNGYIEYPSSGVAALTASGREHAPEIDVPATAEEMLARCKEIVTRPQYEILSALANVYPHAMAKGDLAERAGASSTSSSYGNNLGALRSAGMIEYPSTGKVKLSSWVMLED